MGKTAKTVLILEDQPLIAIDIEELLLESGFQNVILMSSCADAAEWLKTNHPDVAILDIRLRDGECVEVARTLVERRVPFLVHSARSEKSTETDLVFHEGNWIDKPSLPENLLGALHEALDQAVGKRFTDAE